MKPIYVREATLAYKAGPGVLAPASRIASSADASQFFRNAFPPFGPEERMLCLAVDNKNRPVAWTTISVGGLAHCPVDVGSIFRFVLSACAAGFLLAHNHPSGDASPSSDDIEVTQRIKKAAELLGLRFLDHVILTETETFSFLDQNRVLGSDDR